MDTLFCFTTIKLLFLLLFTKKNYNVFSLHVEIFYDDGDVYYYNRITSNQTCING